MAMPCVRVSPRRLEGTQLSLDGPGERPARGVPTLRSRECAVPPHPDLEAGPRSREHADLSRHTSLRRSRRSDRVCGRTRVERTHRAGALPLPRIPRGQRNPGGAGGPGLRTATALPVEISSALDLGNRRLFAVNEQPRGAARGGAPRCPFTEGSAGTGGNRPGGSADRAGSSAVPVRRLPPPRGLGAAESPPCGSAGLVISEVLEAAWGELYFHLHVRRYRCH